MEFTKHDFFASNLPEDGLHAPKRVRGRSKEKIIRG
jgi:hypothetical protein